MSPGHSLEAHVFDEIDGTEQIVPSRYVMSHTNVKISISLPTCSSVLSMPPCQISIAWLCGLNNRHAASRAILAGRLQWNGQPGSGVFLGNRYPKGWGC